MPEVNDILDEVEVQEEVEPEVNEAEDQEVETQEPETEQEQEEQQPEPVDELAGMRSLVRTLRQELADTNNELIKIKNVQVAPQPPETQEPKFRILYDQEGNEVKIPLEQPKQEPTIPQTTQYDQVKAEYNATVQQRAANAETLFEMMKLHQNYSGIENVVTPQAIENVYDRLAAAHSQRSGIDYNTSLMMVKTAVLKQPNPYGYLYGILKQEKEQIVPQTAKAKAKVPAKAPASVATFGDGGKTTTGGWTAKRIDEMPEDEWHTIPKDIKDKYMRNELK